ncbi:hypothetical protein M0L20_27460 [Spirosoma sp. RP8]|uniref:Uncharacterized protein n=1 Tax=Spirosoma liriopis TaxID=2937440 RepID=A0ABT0HTX1_9BACT|nr:hypothetical protein [Spirosoma liriopis]MCK8495634.1 hypothetical protein [Spirosoma liriopis]
MRRTFFLILAFLVSTNCLRASADSTRQRRFQKLADEMRLKKPKLKEGDYEVRIWNRQSLQYGDAQMLYRLIKRKETFTVTKSIILWNKHEFKHATEFNSNRPVTVELWQKLLQHNILTLPDMTALRDQLFPKPEKDSTWNVIEPDGTVSVKAKRKRNKWIIIGDGEGYYFQVFGKDSYHDYEYSNPLGYVKEKTEIIELCNVVAILHDLAPAFQSTQ